MVAPCGTLSIVYSGRCHMPVLPRLASRPSDECCQSRRDSDLSSLLNLPLCLPRCLSLMRGASDDSDVSAFSNLAEVLDDDTDAPPAASSCAPRQPDDWTDRSSVSGGLNEDWSSSLEDCLAFRLRFLSAGGLGLGPTRYLHTASGGSS